MPDALKTGVAKSKIARKRWLCGTPEGHCVGAPTKCSSHLGRNASVSTHETPQAAYRCYETYLLSEGYVKGRNHEYSKPPTPENPYGGPIRMLTKPSRFGARLRGGKEGRSMPYDFIGGTLISM